MYKKCILYQSTASVILHAVHEISFQASCCHYLQVLAQLYKYVLKKLSVYKSILVSIIYVPVQT